MNSKEALKELTERRLVFGDDKQIAAVRFLSSLESAKESVRKCKNNHRALAVCTVCDGYGTHTCPDCDDEHECGECGGSGTLGKINVRKCECLNSYSNDVQDEVIAWMRETQRPRLVGAA